MKLLKRIFVMLLLVALLAPTVALLASAADGEEQTPVAASLTPVKDGKGSIVTLVFDDGNWESALFLDEQMKKYDLTASLMLITRRLEETNEEEGWHLYTEWQQKVFSNGYLTPENHSYSHMVLPSDSWAESNNHSGSTNTPENYQKQLVYSKQQLQEWFGTDAITFAASNNTLSDGAMEVAMQTFYSIRMGARGTNTTNPADTTENGGWYNLLTQRMDGTTYEKNVGWINSAVDTGGWFLGFGHAIPEGEKQEIFIQTFEYMHKLEDEGKIWVANFDEATKYIRARQNSTVSAYQSGSSIFVKVDINEGALTAGGLPITSEIFDVPLTVKVAVPSAWKAVSYELGGVKHFVKTFTDSEGTFAYVDALPSGAAVEVEAAEYASGITTPSIYGTLSADGFAPEKLWVSGQTVTLANDSKVYARVNVSDYQDGTPATLPIVIKSNASATLDIYGIINPALSAGWNASTLNGINAPASDKATGGMTNDAMLIGSLDISGEGTYLFDVGPYLAAMKAKGAAVGTVVIALDDASASDSVSIAFGTKADVPVGTGSVGVFTPYSYTYDFESFTVGSNGNILRGGVNSGSGASVTASTAANHTPGQSSSKALEWICKSSNERIFIPLLLNGNNALTAADIGQAYKITLWVKTSDPINMQMSMYYYDSSSKATPNKNEFDVIYTPTEEVFGEWVQLSYEFTITENMLAANNDAGLDHVYLCIRSWSSNKSFFIDDIVSTKVNQGAQTAVIPTESAATDGEELTVSKNTATNSYKNASYAYLAFTVPTNRVFSETMTLSFTGGEGNIRVYGVTSGTLSDSATLANAPAIKNGTVDPACVYQGIPLYHGAATGDVTLYVKRYAEAVAGECLFLIVSEDVDSTELANITFEKTPFTEGVDYTGTLTVENGVAVSGGERVSLKNCFPRAITGKTVTVTASVSAGVTVTLGGTSVVATEAGIITLVTEEAIAPTEVITFTGEAGFTVDSVSVVESEAPIALSTYGVMWEASVAGGFTSSWQTIVDQAAESGKAVLYVTNELVIESDIVLAPITKGEVTVLLGESGKIVNRNTSREALFTVSGGSLIIEGANPVCDIETGGASLVKRVAGEVTLDGVKVDLGNAKPFADSNTEATYLGICYFATETNLLDEGYVKKGDPGVTYNPTGDYIFTPASISVNISETETFVYNYAVVDTKNDNPDANAVYYAIGENSLILTTIWNSEVIPNAVANNKSGVYLILRDTKCGYISSLTSGDNTNSRSYTFLLDLNGHTLTSTANGLNDKTLANKYNYYKDATAAQYVFGSRGATIIYTSTRPGGELVTGETGILSCDVNRGNHNYFGGYNYKKEKTDWGNNLTVKAGVLYTVAYTVHDNYKDAGVHFNGGKYYSLSDAYSPVRVPDAAANLARLKLKMDADGAAFYLNGASLVHLAFASTHNLSVTNTAFHGASGLLVGEGSAPFTVGAGCSFENCTGVLAVKDNMTVLDTSVGTAIALADGVKLMILKEYEGGVLKSSRTFTLTDAEYAAYKNVDIRDFESGFDIQRFGKFGHDGDTLNTYTTMESRFGFGTFRDNVLANIRLDTSIVLNLYIPTSLPESLTALSIDGKQYTLSETATISGASYYVISIEVAPKDAYRAHTLAFAFDIAGEEKTLSFTYGIAEYLAFLMDYEETSAYVLDSKELAKYVARYIVEASKHFGTYDAQNEGFITFDEIGGDLTLALPEGEALEPLDTFGVTAAFLELESSLGFVFTLDDALANTVITMKFAGENTVYTGTHGVTEGGIHYVVFDGIHAYDFAKRITVTVGELGSFEYDLYTYAKAMVEDGIDNGTGFAVASYLYAKKAQEFSEKNYSLQFLK